MEYKALEQQVKRLNFLLSHKFTTQIDVWKQFKVGVSLRLHQLNNEQSAWPNPQSFVWTKGDGKKVMQNKAKNSALRAACIGQL